jgi:hypothetical protein
MALVGLTLNQEERDQNFAVDVSFGVDPLEWLKSLGKPDKKDILSWLNVFASNLWTTSTTCDGITVPLPWNDKSNSRSKACNIPTRTGDRYDQASHPHFQGLARSLCRRTTGSKAAVDEVWNEIRSSTSHLVGLVSAILGPLL